MPRAMTSVGTRPARRAKGHLTEPNAIPGHSMFLGRPVGYAYNESAFRYFLAADRRRAKRSKRSLLLVLVAIRQSLGRPATLTDATATAIFRGLGASLRDVDFVGWYREGKVAAAVLATGANAPDQVRTLVAERVIPALKERLSAERSRNLRVRVLRLGGLIGVRSQ